MPQRWLFKTEPSAYSFDQLERDGKTTWDGVKNPVARKHLGAVKRGDQILIYHTGDEKAVIGVAKALDAGHPDPNATDARDVVVEIAAVRRLPRPVTLAEVKARRSLASFDLVRLPRLSVMPVSDTQWEEIDALANA